MQLFRSRAFRAQGVSGGRVQGSRVQGLWLRAPILRTSSFVKLGGVGPAFFWRLGSELPLRVHVPK